MGIPFENGFVVYYTEKFIVTGKGETGKNEDTYNNQHTGKSSIISLQDTFKHREYIQTKKGDMENVRNLRNIHRENEKSSLCPPKHDKVYISCQALHCEGDDHTGHFWHHTSAPLIVTV